MEAKKRCELCSKPARMFCDSDEASLCWDCDEKVHAANFLVAKHSRTILCHGCQSPTPWSAAGRNLGRTVSVCHACVDRRAASISRRGEGDACDSPESESVDEGEYYSERDDFSEGEGEEAEGENQVVPWSDPASESPPPPHAMAANCSGSEDNVSFSSSKRTRENNYESEDEDRSCSSPNMNSDKNYCFSVSLLPAQKMQRRSSDGPRIPSEEKAAAGEEARCFSGTAAIVERLRSFGTEKRDVSEMMQGLCRLTGD